MGKKREVIVKETRKQISRREQEAVWEKRIKLITAAVVVLIAGVLVFGVINELVLKPNTTVAKIGDTQIKATYFQARVRYQRLQIKSQVAQYQNFLAQIDPNDEQMASLYQQFQTQATSLENQLKPELATLLGGQVLDQIVEEELVRQEAAARGLSVSADEVTQSIEQMMGYDRTKVYTDTTNLPSGTLTSEAEFNEVYSNFKKNWLDVAKLSEVQFRAMVEADLLRTRLKEALSADMEKTADQVLITMFRLPDEASAKALSDRFQKGESIEDMVKALQEDNNDETFAYAMTEWQPVGFYSTQLSADLEKIIFNTPVNKLSQPQLGPDGKSYYLFYINGHEIRELSASTLQQKIDARYNEWLQQARNERSQTFEVWQQFVPTTP